MHRDLERSNVDRLDARHLLRSRRGYADWHGAIGIQAAGEAHIGVAWTMPGGRIEPDPSQSCDIGFGPAMQGVDQNGSRIGEVIAAGKAGRDGEMMRACDEDMCEARRIAFAIGE